MANGPDKTTAAQNASPSLASVASAGYSDDDVAVQSVVMPTEDEPEAVARTRLVKLEQELTATLRLLDDNKEEIARLRGVAEQRERQLAKRDAQIAALNDARATADRRVNQFAEQLRTLTASQQSLLENRKALDVAKSDVERELGRTRQLLQKASQDIARLDGARATQAAQLEIAQAALERATQDIARTDDEKAAQAAELIAAQAALERATQDIAWIDGEKAAQAAELAAAQAALERATQDIARIDGEKAAQAVELTAVQAALERATQDIAWIDGEKAAQAAELTIARAALEKAVHDIAWIDGEKVAQATELAAAQAALEQASHHIAWIDGEKAGLQRDLAERDAHLEALREELNRLTDGKHSLEQHINNLSATLDHVRHDLSRRQEEIEQLHHELGSAAECLAERQEQLNALAAERDAIAQGRVALEEQVQSSERALEEQQSRIDDLTREVDGSRERFAFQTAQLATARAEFADLAQDRDAITTQLESVRDELALTQDRCVQKENEARRLGMLVQSNIDELSKRDRELQQRQVEIEQGLADRQALEQRRQEEAAALRQQLLDKDQLLDDQKRENRDLLNRLSQTESALRQRQLETEQTAEEIRAARREIEQGMADRQVLEHKLKDALEDLLLQKDILAQSQADHEVALKARFTEIATLSSLLTDVEARVSSQVQDMAHLKVARNELATQGQTLYRQLCEMVDALLDKADVKWLPRKIVLRRQRAILKKYGLIELGWYSHQNPDVVHSGMDVVTHYLTYGRGEGRSPSRAAATFEAGVSAFLGNAKD